MDTEIESSKDSAPTSSSNSNEKKEESEPESNLVSNQYEVQVKLADLQADPNSPLYSVKSF